MRMTCNQQSRLITSRANDNRICPYLSELASTVSYSLSLNLPLLSLSTSSDSPSHAIYPSNTHPLLFPFDFPCLIPILLQITLFDPPPRLSREACILHKLCGIIILCIYDSYSKQCNITEGNLLKLYSLCYSNMITNREFWCQGLTTKF